MHAYTYQIALNPEITTINSLSGLTLPPVLFIQRASGPLAQLVEQLTFNQWVTGSNPVRLTTVFNDLGYLCAERINCGATLGLLFFQILRVQGWGVKNQPLLLLVIPLKHFF